MAYRAAMVAAFATILIWSFSYPVARVGLRHFDPLHLSGLRLVAAALALSVIALPRRVGLPERGDRLRVVTAGLIGMTFYLSILYVGLRVVESASTAILIALTPIFVAVLSGPMIGERLTLWGWSGLLLAFPGAALVILGQAGGLDLGLSSLLLLVAALAHALYNVMVKSLVARYSPLQVASWSMWVGAVTSLPLLVRAPDQVASAPWDALLSFIYLGVCGSALGFVLWGRAMVGAPAAVVSSALYATPPLSAFIGWLWLDERPTVWVVMGGVVVLGAVTMVIRRGVAPALEGS
ncbi:MAG: DMT family transporter [bacterium]|nr:DMT family transporter [bacterium]